MKTIKREELKMGVICFVCGAMFGGLVGTVTMCLVQLGKENNYGKTEKKGGDKL